MFLVPTDHTSDPWYNLGRIAGIALGKGYEARTSREAGKQKENQKAQELYELQDQANQALQGAYTSYDTAKNNLMNEGTTLGTNYNSDPSQANYNAMVKWINKVHPGAEINGTAMTDAMNYVKSGEAYPLQALRQAAVSSAQAINPYVDLSSSTWGSDTYNMGVNRANYTKNFEASNQGKTVSGKGDKKYQKLADYNRTNPYNSTASGVLQATTGGSLSQAQPVDMKFTTTSTPSMTLQSAQPLGNYFNFGGLQKYVNQ